MDVAAFLARHPPFDGLSRDRLNEIARNVRIEYFPRGTTILQEGGTPAAFSYVVRKGAVEVSEGGHVLDVLMEGEGFGQVSLFSGLAPIITARAQEDTICYLVDGEVARKVFGSASGLAFFSSLLRRQFLRAEQVHGAARPDPATVTVGQLIPRRPVTCEPNLTVRDAATLMARERVSSLLIPMTTAGTGHGDAAGVDGNGGGLGILTDRDLRTRVLAEGRSPDTPVERLMSFPAQTIPPDMTAAEVVSLMYERGFHHFPVVERDGRLVGMVTDTDLMRLERYAPVTLKSAIERAPDREGLIAAGRDLPKVVFALMDAHADPVDVGHVVGVTVDALTRRAIDLAIADLGDAPVPWAWMALGSAARHEQALHSDQDHALAFDRRDGDPADVDPYFEQLATRVTDDLEAVGLPRCTGGAMAENPQLRRSLDGWVAAFREWMDDPGLEGSLLSSIAFDYRRVTGPLDVDRPLDEVIGTAPSHPQFIRHLSRRALDESPPTGFFRDVVVEAKGEHAGTLDVKHRGITLVTNLARTYAISAGIAEKRTLARLRAAHAAGVIDEETRAGLSEAFRLLWGVRLRHQVDQVRDGNAADDHVDPRALGPLERRQLKEAFRVIVRAQRVLAADLGVRAR
jgi:CBS domain-containing protein